MVRAHTSLSFIHFTQPVSQLLIPNVQFFPSVLTKPVHPIFYHLNELDHTLQSAIVKFVLGDITSTKLLYAHTICRIRNRIHPRSACVHTKKYEFPATRTQYLYTSGISRTCTCIHYITYFNNLWIHRSRSIRSWSWSETRLVFRQFKVFAVTDK